MAWLADFVVIRDAPFRIGDGPGAARSYSGAFNTVGRISGTTAFLILNIKGLTATAQNPEVHINHQPIGEIYHYGPEVETGYWFTQMIAFDGDILNNGDNNIGIPGVYVRNSDSDFDDYYVKDVICFFHQRS